MLPKFPDPTLSKAIKAPPFGSLKTFLTKLSEPGSFVKFFGASQ